MALCERDESKEEELVFEIRDSIGLLIERSNYFCDSFCVGMGMALLLGKGINADKDTGDYLDIPLRRSRHSGAVSTARPE